MSRRGSPADWSRRRQTWVDAVPVPRRAEGVAASAVDRKRKPACSKLSSYGLLFFQTRSNFHCIRGVESAGSRVECQELLLYLVHLVRPKLLLLIKRNCPRMIRNGYIGVHRSLSSPFLEGWVKRRQLLYIVPDRLNDACHHGIGGGPMRCQTDIVRDEAGVIHHSQCRPGFDDTRVIPRDSLAQAFLPFRRAVDREMPHPNGGVGLSDFRGVQCMLSDVHTALDQGIDSLVRARHPNDFYIFPAKPCAGEGAEHVVPDSQLRGILSREPFAFDIVNRFDGRILAHEQAYQERRAAHHQAHIGNVRKWILPTDL